MHKSYINYMLLVISFLGLASCEYQFSDPEAGSNKPVDSQGLVLDKYIALGGSVTAGFMDNALYSEGQLSSYPVLLSETFKAANENLEFTMPDVNDEIGYTRTVVVNQTETYHLGRLKFDEPGNVAAIKGDAYNFIYDEGYDPGRVGCPHVVRSMYETSDSRPQDFFTPYSGDEYHNFALPNVSLVNMFNTGLGDPLDANFSDYYARVKTDTTDILIEDALNVDYTFVTMWFGLTELTTFALDGGQGFLTSPADFRTRLRSVMGAILRKRDCQGAIATVPRILDFPFFTETTQNSGVNRSFTLTAQKATEINEAYWAQGYARIDYFKEGENHYLIETRDGTLRQFQPGKEYVTVDFAASQDSLGDGQVVACDNGIVQGEGLGIIHLNQSVQVEEGRSVPKAFPIRGELVLDAEEVEDLSIFAALYNEEIRNALNAVVVEASTETSPVVKAADVMAIVDLENAFQQFNRNGSVLGESGFPIMFFDNGIAGFFSSDGLHMTPKGQAWIANNFITAINGRFGTNFPQHDLLIYRGNDYDYTP